MFESYMDWLLDRVNFRRKGYYKLMLRLYNIPFEAKIDRDENRIDDAYSLRSEYLFHYHVESLPSVLEVLVALAIRMDDEYIGDPANPDPSKIFWEMCTNLGLNKFSDRFFDDIRVLDIVEEWIDRQFDYDGRGGIFPIKDPIQDQRKIEIWSQMQEYLSENYS